jgi:signal peptidase I
VHEAYVNAALADKQEHFGPVVIPKQGETIAIQDDHHVYLNDQAVPLPAGVYFPRQSTQPLSGFEVFYGPLLPPGTTLQRPVGPLTVRSDYYFMLGDNRRRSLDSRAWGFVPAANIEGIVEKIY